MAFEASRLAAIPYIPEAYRLIPAGRKNPTAVRCDSDGENVCRVSFPALKLLAGFQLPQPGCSIITTGNDVSAVRRHSQTQGRMGLKPAKFLAVLHIPEVDNVVLIAYQTVSVCRERDHGSSRAMPFQAAEDLALLQVPHEHSGFGATRGGVTAVRAGCHMMNVFLVSFKATDFFALH